MSKFVFDIKSDYFQNYKDTNTIIALIKGKYKHLERIPLSDTVSIYFCTKCSTSDIIYYDSKKLYIVCKSCKN